MSSDRDFSVFSARGDNIVFGIINIKRVAWSQFHSKLVHVHQGKFGIY